MNKLYLILIVLIISGCGNGDTANLLEEFLTPKVSGHEDWKDTGLKVERIEE